MNKGIWQSPTGAVEVAVKTLQSSASQKDRVKFLQEAAINGQFRHPNVVKLLGVVTVGEPVSEQCSVCLFLCLYMEALYVHSIYTCSSVSLCAVKLSRRCMSPGSFNIVNLDRMCIIEHCHQWAVQTSQCGEAPRSRHCGGTCE